ncbi:hypothetical protein [Lacunimicrobium album]
MKTPVIALIVCLCFASGCGGPASSGNTVDVDYSADMALKKTLGDVAKGDEVGSAESTINEQFAKLKAARPDTASAIEADIQQLLKLKGPKMKEKANEIIGKI